MSRTKTLFPEVETPTTAQATAEKTIDAPCGIIIDTREQQPYTFQGLRANADQGHALLRIPTCRIALPVGDYTVQGLAEQVVVERKSKEDLYGSIGQRRQNFEERLKVMAIMASAAVVVEAEWASVLLDPPTHSKLHPRALSRTILSWIIRYPRVHWLMLPDRQTAEAMTYRYLERFHWAWKIGETGCQEAYLRAKQAGEDNRWITPWEEQV